MPTNVDILLKLQLASAKTIAARKRQSSLRDRMRQKSYNDRKRPPIVSMKTARQELHDRWHGKFDGRVPSDGS